MNAGYHFLVYNESRHPQLRADIFGFLISWFLMKITAIFFRTKSKKLKFHIVWVIISANIYQIVMKCCTVVEYCSPDNSWNFDKSQIQIGRLAAILNSWKCGVASNSLSIHLSGMRSQRWLLESFWYSRTWESTTLGWCTSFQNFEKIQDGRLKLKKWPFY